MMILIFILLLASPIAYATPKEVVNLYSTYTVDSIEGHRDSLYVVKKGETLYSIAKSEETTVAMLKAWNNLTSDEIQAGKILLVIDPNMGETTLVEEAPNLPKATLEDSIHVVAKGEYISGIAAKYHVAPKSIAKWNKLVSPDRIYPGQELKLYPVEITSVDSLKVQEEIPIVLHNKDSLKSKTLAVQTENKPDATALPISNNKSIQKDTAVNSNLSYDFTPGGVKTLLNVLVLVLLLVVFIYNIHK